MDLDGHTHLTEADLQAIEEREQGAHPGPWERWVGHASVHAGVVKNDPNCIRTRNDSESGVVCECDEDDLGEDGDDGQQIAQANALFIAHARTDVPRLVAEVRALRQYIGEINNWTPEEVDEVATETSSVGSPT